MKNLLLIIPFLFLTSCINESEFSVPPLEVEPPDLIGTYIDLNELYDLWLQEYNNSGMNDLITLTIEEEWYTTGFVISSDEYGNFFEELIIQDTPSDSSIGVKILIDESPLYTKYDFGRRIHIQLKGLTIGLYRGLFTIGIKNNDGVDKIHRTQLDSIIKRDIESVEIIPTQLNIGDFTLERTNSFIQISEAQFNNKDVLGDRPKTYSGDPEDEYVGERILEHCGEDFNTILSTSTFSKFKAQLLPAGKGEINGILSLNYSGDQFNIIVNSSSDISFEDPERCDLTEIQCGLSDTTGDTIIFSDDFETEDENNPISGNGWSNIIESGTQHWEAFSDNGQNASLGISARIGSYNSDDAQSISWLVTPSINFDDQDGETLNFKTSNSFSDGSELKVFFSKDWTGDPNDLSTATWEFLSDATIVDDDTPFDAWIPSGNIDLNCISGTGYIAFKYIGSGNEFYDGTFELDEITINSN
jgi:hypothetical protein